MNKKSNRILNLFLGFLLVALPVLLVTSPAVLAGPPGFPEMGLTITDQSEDAGTLYPGVSGVVQIMNAEDTDSNTSNTNDVTVTRAEIDDLGDTPAANIDTIEVMEGSTVRGSASVSNWPVTVDLSGFTVADKDSVTVNVKVYVSDSPSASTLQLQTTLVQDEGDNTGIQKAVDDGVAEEISVDQPGSQIGTFSDGKFYIDWNGSLDWTPGVDKIARWGSSGDQALVGDFNPNEPGDEIGTFSDGKFYIDWNGSLDWTPGVDKIARWGSSGDQALVGDFNPSTSSRSPSNLNWDGGSKNLTINNVLTYPNPVTKQDSVTFSVQGKGIEAMKVDVFTASGSKVFSSGFRETNSIDWSLTTTGGSRVSNGIYLYAIGVKGSESTLSSDTQKLLILR